MNILHITQTAGPSGGGVAKYIHDLIDWLFTKGHDSKIISCDRLAINQLPSYVTVASRSFPKALGRSNILSHLKTLKVYPDIIHIHGLRCYHNAQAHKWALKNKIPIIVTPHAQLMPWTMKQNYFKKWIYDFFIEKPLLKKSNALHFVSLYERKNSHYQYIYEKKSHIASIGVNHSQWTKLKPRALPDVDLNRPTITFFSHLSIRKGLDLLIDSLTLILKQFPNLQVIIAGTDPDNIAPKLLARAKALSVDSCITWIIPIERAQARWLIDQSNLYLLPSRAEGFPIGIIEALALGTRVIATKETSWVSLQKKELGFNCELNHNSVARAIISGLVESKKTLKCHCSGILEQYTWDNCGNAMLNIYEAISKKYSDQIT
jgi:glycosyltransferase involved in cell wall biosynthesis